MDEDRNGIGKSEVLIQHILSCVDVDDLFRCCEVNCAWEAVSLRLLRKKLKHFSYYSSAENAAAEHSYIIQDFCTKTRKYRSVALKAGHKPALLFLLYRSSWRDDNHVVRKVRRMVPHKCVVLFFKDKPAEQSIVSELQDRLSGTVLFRPCPKRMVARMLQKDQKAVTRRTPSDFYSSRGSLNRVSEFFRRLMFGQPGPSSVSTFRNTSPGVMTFQAKVNAPLEDSDRITTYYIERSTGSKLQVTTTTLRTRLRQRSTECIQSLKENFACTSNTVIVVFQRDLSDMFVVHRLDRVFQDVPAILLHSEVVEEAMAIASDGTATPLDRRLVLIMVLRLIPETMAQEAANGAAPNYVD
ncbi:uncharacterized protein LOC135367893 [Ornithodoros turicata]|uniref:uncharacterized protein LOC135367893 n=1 Tax=Ornithodoros turicata TaxID=34597 RepID=UPI00313996D9